MNSDRIKSLDGVRGVAVILILVYHFLYLHIQGRLGILGRIVGSATHLGWSGVDLFFVLSGFLIGKILIENRESVNYFSTFYARRALRIFPLYYLVVISFIFVSYINIGAGYDWLFGNAHPLWSYFLYLQNFFVVKDGFGANYLGITWSLAVEEQFYLILPALIYMFKNRILYFVVPGIILAPIIRSLLPKMGAYVLLPGRMDALLIGVFIAYLFVNGRLVPILEHRKKLTAVFVLVLAITLAIGRTPLWDNIGGVVSHSVLAILYGLLILVALSKSFIARFLENSILRFFGKISYGIYIYNTIFFGLAHSLILNQSPKISNSTDVIVTLFSLVLTLVVSVLSYNFFESRFLNYAKKFQYKFLPSINTP